MNEAIRKRYVFPITKTAWAIDAARTWFEDLLEDPVFLERTQKAPMNYAMYQVALATLEWVRNVEPEGEFAEDWHALLDGASFNASTPERQAEMLPAGRPERE